VPWPLMFRTHAKALTLFDIKMVPGAEAGACSVIVTNGARGGECCSGIGVFLVCRCKSGTSVRLGSVAYTPQRERLLMMGSVLMCVTNVTYLFEVTD
jgi:hypothetical protein